jgi:hypothetical protein
MLNKGWRRILIVCSVLLLLFVAGVTYKDAEHSCDLDMSLRLDQLIQERIANDKDQQISYQKNIGSKPIGATFIAHYNNVVSGGFFLNNMEDLLHQVQLEAKTGSLCDGKIAGSLLDSAKGIAFLAA